MCYNTLEVKGTNDIERRVLTMMTLKAVARNTENKLYTLAVMHEDGIVAEVLAKNVDIDTIVTLEKWFDMSKLAGDEYLTWVFTDCNGKHYYKLVDIDGESNWWRIGA